MRRPDYRTDRTHPAASPPQPSLQGPPSYASIGTSTANDLMITANELLLHLGTNGGRISPANLHWDLRSSLHADDPVALAPHAEPARRRRPTGFGPASTARAAPPMPRRRRQMPMVPEWMLDPLTWMPEEELAKKCWPEARSMSVEEVAEYNRKAMKEDREENERLSKQKEKGIWYLPAGPESFHEMVL